MVTQIINSDPTALKAIEVKSSSPLTQILPTLAIGEILKVSVRSKQGNGQGMIGIKGLLLQATLPEGVQSGDKLSAQITSAKDAIVLKILNLEKASTQKANLSELPGLEKTLGKQLENLIKAPGPNGLRPTTSQKIELPLPDAETGNKLADSLLKILKTIDGSNTLTDAKTALSKLTQTTTGSLNQTLREAAAALKELAHEASNPNQLATVFQALEQQLTELNLPGDKQATYTHQSLIRVTDVLTRELKEFIETPGNSDKPETMLLKNILSHLGKGIKMPTEQQEHIQAALEELKNSPLHQNTEIQYKDPNLPSELQSIAKQLNQMAHMQETLNEINPVMQALGEPALILFPAMFQGLLFQSKVTVDTSGQGNNKKSKEEFTDRKKGKGKEPYNKIQMRVPLPYFGDISVNIGYRQGEILARFVVDNIEKQQFLDSRLEQLGQLLNEHGFNDHEFYTAVGDTKATIDSWSDILSATPSLIA